MWGQVVQQAKCELFGSFGFIVQFGLGIFSFMCLISRYYLILVKRQIEFPKRSWRIWMLVKIN